MDLGHAIKVERVKRRLKQKELAEALGVSESYISLLEGNNRDISLKFLKELCEYFNCKVSYLFFEAEKYEAEAGTLYK